MAYPFRLIAKRDIKSRMGKTLLQKGRCIEFDNFSSSVGMEDAKSAFQKQFGEIPQLCSINAEFEVVKL